MFGHVWKCWDDYLGCSGKLLSKDFALSRAVCCFIPSIGQSPGFPAEGAQQVAPSDLLEVTDHEATAVFETSSQQDWNRNE